MGLFNNKSENDEPKQSFSDKIKGAAGGIFKDPKMKFEAECKQYKLMSLLDITSDKIFYLKIIDNENCIMVCSTLIKSFTIDNFFIDDNGIIYAPTINSLTSMTVPIPMSDGTRNLEVSSFKYTIKKLTLI